MDEELTFAERVSLAAQAWYAKVNGAYPGGPTWSRATVLLHEQMWNIIQENEQRKARRAH